MYSAFNVIPSEKELQIFQETGHWTFPEQNELVSGWLTRKLRGQ
jgi:hypothetical protein